MKSLSGIGVTAAGCLAAAVFVWAAPAPAALFEFPAEDFETRWHTPENPQGLRHAGGTANQGAKGNPFDTILAGETYNILDIEGKSGIVKRIWLTVSEWNPVDLRGIRIDAYWDGAETPAVSAPVGDFFGAINGKMVASETAMVSSPEELSFNCSFPMPFRQGARITLTNESDQDVRLFTYEVNVLLTPPHDDDVMYFHAHWRRERFTALGEDFEIMPKVNGTGRFLGAHIGFIQNPVNEGWWGEGEVKIYLDGDDEWPTLVGTGTEDYIGSGWGQEVFHNWNQGSLFDDGWQIGFYRYHLPDPVFFHEDCRVTIQVMGSLVKHEMQALIDKGTANVMPVAIVSLEGGLEYTRLLEPDPARTMDTPLQGMQEWVTFYREDDLSAVAFFYFDQPENGLPPLAQVAERTEGLVSTGTIYVDFENGDTGPLDAAAATSVDGEAIISTLDQPGDHKECFIRWTPPAPLTEDFTVEMTFSSGLESLLEQPAHWARLAGIGIIGIEFETSANVVSGSGMPPHMQRSAYFGPNFLEHNVGNGAFDLYIDPVALSVTNTNITVTEPQMEVPPAGTYRMSIRLERVGDVFTLYAAYDEDASPPLTPGTIEPGAFHEVASVTRTAGNVDQITFGVTSLGVDGAGGVEFGIDEIIIRGADVPHYAPPPTGEGEGEGEGESEFDCGQDLAGKLETFVSLLPADYAQHLADTFGWHSWRDYDMENLLDAPGDGIPDMYQLALVQHVVCNDFAQSAAVRDILESNSAAVMDMFEERAAWAESIGHPEAAALVRAIGEDMSDFFGAIMMTSQKMKDVMLGVLQDQIVEFPEAMINELRPRIVVYNFAGIEPFSAQGGFIGDGRTNIQAYLMVTAAGQGVEAFVVAATQPGDFWPGNPDVPVGGVAAFGAMALLAAAGGMILRKK